MSSAPSTVAQVGQAAVTVATIAAVTVLAALHQVDAMEALAVVLGVAGVGSGVSVAVHKLAAPIFVKTSAPPTPEVPHVPDVLG